MPSLLIEMPSGIAGDMLLGALLDLGGDKEHMQRDLLALGVGEIRIEQSLVMRSGLRAVLVDVHADQDARWVQGGATPVAHVAVAWQQAGIEKARSSPAPSPPSVPSVHLSGSGHHSDVARPDHHHRPFATIRATITAAALPDRVRERALRVFQVLAQAEASVHGVEPENVLFHEVGGIDALAVVVGCCLLLEQLAITRVVSGPLMPGNGSVTCAHGLMPVPVPAVAAMLASSGAPWRHRSDDTGELTTPTGCALVVALADAFIAHGHTPTFTTRRVGYGAGHKDLPGGPNLVRVSLIDEIAETTSAGDVVCELRCAMDDATGEALGVVIEELLEAGCADAYLTPVLMKKGRPGFELTVLCHPQDEALITRRLLICSSSIGVRRQSVERTTLPRIQERVVVAGQVIACKVVTLPDGTKRAKPEADDVQKAARHLGRSFVAVQQSALQQWSLDHGSS